MFIIEEFDRAKTSTLFPGYSKLFLSPRDDYHAYERPKTSHSVHKDGEAVAFFSLDGEGHLCEFYIDRDKNVTGIEVFAHILEKMEIKQAWVESVNPDYLLTAMEFACDTDISQRVYELTEHKKIIEHQNITARLATLDDLDMLVEFDNVNTGEAQPWVRGYFEKWIAHNGVYIYSDGDNVVGLGECRRADTSKNVYIGVVVDKERWGQGIGTHIVAHLRNHAVSKGLNPVCTVNKTNIASDKTVRKCGFYPLHRIFKMRF